MLDKTFKIASFYYFPMSWYYFSEQQWAAHIAFSSTENNHQLYGSQCFENFSEQACQVVLKYQVYSKKKWQSKNYSHFHVSLNLPHFFC